MTSRDRLILNVYAPVLTGNDGRTLAVIEGMERALPGVRLAWEISEEGRPLAIPRREVWLAEAAARGDFPLVCNGDEFHPVMVSGLNHSSSSSPGGQPQLQVHARMPRDQVGVAVAMDVMEQVGEGVRAQWGLLAPSPVMQVIADQTGPKHYGPGQPPRGLPALELPEAITVPEIPRHLGWLNYWSAAAARAIGFPDPARDTELLSRSRRTATGGWVVALTVAPLDLDQPAHLEALKRSYARFPEMGGRSPP
ncbi:MAG: DUF5953 family protein [Cystobacter sp.]